MRIRAKRVATLLAAAGLSILALPAAGLASQPDAVSLELNGVITGPDSVAGSWVATGAVSDSGTYVETYDIRGATVHVVKRLTGSQGTIELAAQAVMVFTSPSVAVFKAGQWRFVSGTGAYATLQGEGSPAAGGFVDIGAGTISVTHVGIAHYD
jgi:hypothetical protein